MLIYRYLEQRKKRHDYKIDCFSNRYKEYLGVKYLFKSNYSFEEKQSMYDELIKGLDEKSIITVNEILRRVEIYQKTEIVPAKINFSRNEENIICRLISEYSKIKSVFGKYWKYKKYKLPINHFEVCVFSDKCSVPFLKNKLDIKNKNIIDVGAFIGDSSIILSEYTKKNVYAFEPVRKNYDSMIETICLNRKKNIIPCNFALGSETSEAKINLSGSSSSFFNKITCNEEDVRIFALDDFINKNKIDIGLIKVDIEGFEQEFLKGAKETISAQKPSLIISIYHNFNDFFLIKPIIDSWNLGYKFKIRKPIDGQILYETVLIAEIPNS